VSAVTFAFLSLLVLFVITLRLIRIKKLNFKYSVAWTSLTAVALVFGLTPQFLDSFARFVGFSTSSNFVLFVAVLFLALVALQLSVGLSRIEQRIETVAREIALSGVTQESSRDDAQ
jgi:hypothetical protein